MLLNPSNTDDKTLTVIHYHRRDRHAVHDLLGRTSRVHTHLDWYETDQWLDTAPTLAWTIWQKAQIVGVMGFSEPLQGASWLRVLAIDVRQDIDSLLTDVLQRVRPELCAAGVQQIALLQTQAWLGPHAAQLGFVPYDTVITLRQQDIRQMVLKPAQFKVRSYSPLELHRIVKIDQAAFVAPWQMSTDEIRQAERMAAYVTVAEHGQEIVGYQLSTLYFDGAHLARLAVLPSYQGQGVGRALMSDLIQRFIRRHILTVSVNTQMTNTQSQHLYHRFGFQRTGYDLPVWTVDIA